MFFYQQFHSFNITFFFNTITPPHPPKTPESKLSKVKERLKGLKYSIGFGGKGWGYTEEGHRYVHYGKRGHFTEMSQHFYPSLSECKIVLLHTSEILYDNDNR